MGAMPLLHDLLLWIGALLDRPATPDFSRLTMLEAAEDGWWYAANLPGERVVVAGITDAENNKRRCDPRFGPMSRSSMKTPRSTGSRPLLR
jgi:hypothetical protein